MASTHAPALGDRVFACLDALAQLSEQADALTRRALTAPHRDAMVLVAGWMEQAGMRVRTDPIGNVIGRYEGARSGLPALPLGSHLDTVRDAGRYDGALGVVVPIVCVQELANAGERLPFAVEVHIEQGPLLEREGLAVVLELLRALDPAPAAARRR